MALLGYPEHLLDEQGNPKPGVTGPSPASMGLLSAGLGMLSTPTYSRLPGDMSGIGQGAMQGLQAYQERLNQIQQQRKDYNQSLMQAQNQEMAKQRFGLEMGEAKRQQQLRDQKIKELPNLLQSLRQLGTPGIDRQIIGIESMARSGNVDGAYQAATNILSQKIPQKTELEYKEYGDNVLVIDKTTGKFVAQFNKGDSTSPSGDNLTEGRLLNSLFRAAKNKDIEPIEYQQIYRAMQEKNSVKGTTTDATGGTTLSVYSAPIMGIPTPWEYAQSSGIEDPSSLGIQKSGAYSGSLPGGGQKPLSATQGQEGRKISQIAEAEVFYNELLEKGFDPSKMNATNVFGYYTGKLKSSPFTGDARSYEQIAEMGGASIGYLFSGANVPTEEMHRFRLVYYPIPGDSPSDIARKKRARLSLINYSNQLLPEEFQVKVSGLMNNIKKKTPKELTDPEAQNEILNETESLIPEPGSVEDDNAAEVAAEVAASLDLGSKKPEKPKRGIEKFQKSGKVSKVSVLPGDGISQILRAAGLKYTQPNIDEIVGYRLNKGRFNPDGTIKKSGGVIYIPKSIYRK